jgi:hypothetical protein
LLNELHAVGVALADAGIPVTIRHPDVKDVPERQTLRVQLGPSGDVARVAAIPATDASRLWTLRDGQHNSFPYHQLKSPLLRISADDERVARFRGKSTPAAERWSLLLSIAGSAEFNTADFTEWPGAGYLRRIAERNAALAALCDSGAAAVPAAFERFGRGAAAPLELLRSLVVALAEGMQRGRFAIDDLPLLTALLLDGKAGLYFDVTRDFSRLAGDDRNVAEISRALRSRNDGGSSSRVCSITGQHAFLVDDKFPQPTLPILGQTYLFARNRDAPTGARYGRAGTDSVDVGAETATLLQAAVERLTHDDWEGRTWCGIPGERPKQRDLFVAFVQGAEDVRLAALLTEDSEPAPGAEDRFASFAERLVEAFTGKLKPRRDAPLSMFVLRKLDPANRKVVYSSNTLTVGALLAAAERWSTGCANVPPTIRLSVPSGAGKPASLQPPWDVAPFSLPRLTRQQFIRGGTQRQEIVGLTTRDAMRLFLAPDGAVTAFATTVLRRVLGGRAVLLEGVGHAQSRGFDDLKVFDRREALDTVTLLGLLLYRLGRPREMFMNDTAYRLGQLLAGADLLHVAYNASERGGATLPPRLIGNAALPMAQSNPARALDVLGRRWAVYDGWAKRKRNQWRFPERFRGKHRNEIEKKDLAEYEKAQTIGRGLSALRRMEPLAAELGSTLRDVEVDEVFRAELLLGYMAGLPRADEVPATAAETENPEQGDE